MTGTSSPTAALLGRAPSGPVPPPLAGPRLVQPGAGTLAPTAPGLPTFEVKLGGAEQAGFSLIEYTIPARFTPPPHLHRHTRECAVTYVLDGQLNYWFADHDAVLGPGTLLQLPPGVWFRGANESDAPARILAMFAPAGFEEFFLDLATAVAGGHEVGRVIGPLRARYGDEDHSDR